MFFAPLRHCSDASNISIDRDITYGPGGVLSTARDRKGSADVVNAAREYSMAAVMLHGVIADRVGLSGTQLKALDLLQRLGPLPAGELATHTGLATASVTSLIDRLEHKGFVRRKRDRSDRRRVVVTLTAKLEEGIAPLFTSLGRRILERCRGYADDQIALLKDFLSGCAGDMRDETETLTKGPKTVSAPHRR
jgi:DNA-binding MarR family transcriptional regulator